jgi:hypothetical protein
MENHLATEIFHECSARISFIFSTSNASRILSASNWRAWVLPFCNSPTIQFIHCSISAKRRIVLRSRLPRSARSSSLYRLNSSGAGILRISMVAAAAIAGSIRSKSTGAGSSIKVLVCGMSVQALHGLLRGFVCWREQAVRPRPTDPLNPFVERGGYCACASHRPPRKIRPCSPS